MKEALYYEKLEEDKVKCLLCPKNCVIGIGKTGFCGSRINQDGRLYSKIYEECSSVAMDPMEKKPLYHFYPGTSILSLGTVGCNLGCVFCQNWHISQSSDAQTRKLSSQEAVSLAKEEKSIGIAYTYSEPLIWYEYVLETAKLAKEQGLTNVLVTNGLINPQPLLELLPYIDALNIDIKSFEQSFYSKYCKGELTPVLNTAKLAREKGKLVEITNLIIPTLNDNEQTIKDLVEWIATELGDDTPTHFSKYYPQYKMNLPPTEVTTLKKAYEIARLKLKYVYLGNISDVGTNTTYCPNCKRDVVVREGYTLVEYKIKDGKCQYCQEVIYGMGM
ncbi:MAG: AmmeMemoRadiSam system radical SAM enzyme [bacterium]|nr:AmmeMemoRadiSam system radical SAM enzyme [bacterium]